MRDIQLQRLLILKKRETESALKALALSRQQFDNAKKRHEQLLDYRQDYLQQIAVLGEHGGVLSQLRYRVDFIEQLDGGLKQMTHHLALIAKDRSQAEQGYIQAKLAEEVVIRLIERARVQQKVIEKRREQKESDEVAEKQWYSNQLETQKMNASD
jgi:flagellar FliJ protein